MNYDECIWVGEVRERPKTTYVRKKLGVDWFFFLLSSNCLVKQESLMET